MFKRIASLENTFSIAKAAGIVGLFAFFSRIVGFARNILFATKLGPGPVLDSYYASFRIPDTVFGLLILGTLSVAFIPVFTELVLKDKRRAFEVANTIFNISVVSMSAICLLVLVFSRSLTKFIVPGFLGQQFEQTLTLTRLFLLSPIIFTASSILTGVLNSYKKFLIVSLAPILYNLAIIFGFLFLYPKFGLIGWSAGVLGGALLHFFIQLPFAIRQGFLWKPVLLFKDEAVKKIGKLFFPRIFGLDNTYVSLLIATIIGSTLPSGSISIFNLVIDLQALPLGIFALSIAIVSFPVLSELFANKNEVRFLEVLQKTIIQISFFILPITILMLLLRAYIVRLSYGHGNFDWAATRLTFTCLGIFSFSLLSQGLAPLLSRAFYARQNTKTPVIINLFTMTLNAVLSYFLAKKFGVIGLAAAFSISSLCNALALYIILRISFESSKSLKGTPDLLNFDKGVVKSLIEIMLSCIGMGIATYATIHLVGPVVNTRTVIGILFQSGLAATLGIITFFYLSLKLKLSQAEQVMNQANRIINYLLWKTKKIFEISA